MSSELFPATWRCVISPPANGSWNMAVDEAIMHSVARKATLPTLRLYAWEPPCCSLGYAQSINEIDLERLQNLDWQIVRRPTGGRAILHTDELTYAVIAPDSEPRMAGGVLESYQVLSQALLIALINLGVQASVQESSNAQAEPNSSAHSVKQQNPVCFEIPSSYEITIAGKKILGSAQARKQGVVLQHGTLPLGGNITRLVQILRFDSETDRQIASKRLLEKATTVNGCVTHPIDWQQAAQTITSAFAQTLNLFFEYAKITRDEYELAKQLQIEKYDSPEWTNRI
jgi:lipoate-protein ligase A